MKPFTEEFLFEELIGEIKPPVSSYPNIVLKAAPESLNKIADFKRARPGWWGSTPFFDQHGRPFESADQVDQFKIWTAERNQLWIREHGGRAKLGHFTMYLDTCIPKQMVAELFAAADPQRELTLQSIWPLIAERLDTLKWTYCPLSDDFPLALFIVAKSEIHFMNLFRTHFAKENIEFGEVLCIEGKERWRLPPALFRMCAVGN